MKKTMFSTCAMALAAVLLLPAFFSCSEAAELLQPAEHAHTYMRYYNGEQHWVECKDCHEKAGEPEAHTLSELETIAATCEHPGRRVLKCTVCNYTETEILPQVAHEYAGTGECVHCHRQESALTELAATERYGYTYLASLSAHETYLRVYEKIAVALAARAEQAYLSETLTADELQMIHACVLADHPEYFWVDSKFTYTYSGQNLMDGIRFTYLISAGDLPQAKVDFQRALDVMLAAVTPAMTDFEKELRLHDAVVRANTYDKSNGDALAHTAYGALVLRRSVCDGYAKLFQLLMTRCGILSAVFSGYAGESHAWNAVRLEGEWYLVDVTWDDPVGQAADETSHTYFNCTSEQFAADHAFVTPSGETVENYYPVPVCTAERYRYYTYFGYEGPLSAATVERVVRLQAEKGETKFEIRITGLAGTPQAKAETICSYVQNDPEVLHAVVRALGLPATSLRLTYGASSNGEVLRLSVD